MQASFSHEQFQDIGTAVQTLPQRVVVQGNFLTNKSLLSSISKVRGRVQTISGKVAAELGGGDITAAMKDAQRVVLGASQMVAELQTVKIYFQDMRTEAIGKDAIQNQASNSDALHLVVQKRIVDATEITPKQQKLMSFGKHRCSHHGSKSSGEVCSWEQFISEQCRVLRATGCVASTDSFRHGPFLVVFASVSKRSAGLRIPEWECHWSLKSDERT